MKKRKTVPLLFMLPLEASAAAFSGDLPDEHWRCGLIPSPSFRAPTIEVRLGEIGRAEVQP